MHHHSYQHSPPRYSSPVKFARWMGPKGHRVMRLEPTADVRVVSPIPADVFTDSNAFVTPIPHTPTTPLSPRSKERDEAATKLNSFFRGHALRTGGTLICYICAQPQAVDETGLAKHIEGCRKSLLALYAVLRQYPRCGLLTVPTLPDDVLLPTTN
eukprot:PhF_6_TR21966/c0_g1_i2/m.31236